MKIVVTLTVLFLCGCSALPGGDNGIEKCVTELPTDVLETNRNLAAKLTAARLSAVNSEQTRIGSEPVKLHSKLSDGITRSIAKSVFPKATPHFLDEASKTNNLEGIYSAFHGYSGAVTVYETEAGSGKYFIIDEVLGDGAGSLTQSQYFEPIPNDDGSMHSWHATIDNRLLRAVFEPDYVNTREVNLCACGTEAAKSALRVPPTYGIFMLPGSPSPSLHPDQMKIKYIDETIRIHSVDKSGKKCPEPVC